jgi:hypothetical protein
MWELICAVWVNGQMKDRVQQRQWRAQMCTSHSLDNTSSECKIQMGCVTHVARVTVWWCRVRRVCVRVYDSQTLTILRVQNHLLPVFDISRGNIATIESNVFKTELCWSFKAWKQCIQNLHLVVSNEWVRPLLTVIEANEILCFGEKWKFGVVKFGWSFAWIDAIPCTRSG